MKRITERIIVVDFVRKKVIDKVRDHCRLTGSYRRPAHNKCNINVTPKQFFLQILHHLYFTNSVKMIVTYFLK